MKSKQPAIPALKEADIERTITDFLIAEGWRVFHMEQQWSEKKRKTVGERNMPDVLAIRYWAGKVGRIPQLHDQRVNALLLASGNEVLWLELKRLIGKKVTKPAQGQLDWHREERFRGALTLIAGVDFRASIEGFMDWYKNSGLARRRAA